MASRKTQFTLALAGLLVLSGLMAGCAKKDKPLEYITQPVRRGNLRQIVTSTGTLGAVVSVDVGSQISGTIHVINVDFNSPVTKGEIVAEIDPRTYAAAVHQAQGDLANAKASLELKQQNLARKKELFGQQAATQADLDTASSEMKQAEATVEIKEAALEKSQADLDYCKILAPVDGIVISREVDVGQTVAASLNTPVLFTIAQDITKMQIDSSVSEADIGQVKVGQKVNFTVDAFPDEVFEGKVSQVRMAPITTENVVTYSTIIDVDNPEKKLFPGMTAEVSVNVAQRKDALLVPNAALRFTPPEEAKFAESPAKSGPRHSRGESEVPEPTALNRSQRTLYTLAADGKTLATVPVRIGITDGTRSEILEGLNEGDMVVTASKGGAAKASGAGGASPRGPFGGGGGGGGRGAFGGGGGGGGRR